MSLIKPKSLSSVILVTLMALLTAAGCGAAGSSSESTGGLEQSSGSNSSGEAPQKKTMGVTVSNKTNPFFVMESRTAESTGKSLGYRVLSQEAREDVQRQTNQIDQFITAGVQFIVIDPVDSEAVGPAVKRAMDAGIPVVGIDSETKGAAVSVTTDNVQAGVISCKSLVKQLHGKGKIAILDGTPISAVEDRVTGCKKVLEQHPGIDVVAHQRGNNSRDKAVPIATDILTAHPDLDGVFAINDPTATGVELAAKQKNMDIIITSVDGAQVAIDSIKSGGMITATAAQDPAALARKGTKLGKKLAGGGGVDQKVIELPTKLIDKSNVADYEPWG